MRKFIPLMWFVMFFSVSSMALTELDKCIEDVANGLFSGRIISREEIKDIIKEIEASKPSLKHESGSSDESLEGAASTSSISSRDSIEGIEISFNKFLDGNWQSPQQIIARTQFIEMLRSLQGTVNDDALTEAVMKIGQNIFE